MFLGRSADTDLFDMEVVEQDVEAPDISLEKLRFALSFYVSTGDGYAEAGSRNLVDGGWLETIARQAKSSGPPNHVGKK